MKKAWIIALYTCCLTLMWFATAWATDYEDDSQAEFEAQKDMLAYVQSTFPYRFGNDLQAGDYVRYEITDQHSENEEPELCSLEVTERKGDVATIKEEFEGNIIYYKLNLQRNTLLEYWGFDEEGIEQRPSLLSASEVETRMQAMKGIDNTSGNRNLPEGIAKPVFYSLHQRASIPIGRSSLDCSVKTLDIPDIEGITPELKQAVQELTKVFFSEAVPKLLPAKLMAVYLDNPEVFAGNSGLVKQSEYQIIEFTKADR